MIFSDVFLNMNNVGLEPNTENYVACQNVRKSYQLNDGILMLKITNQLIWNSGAKDMNMKVIWMTQGWDTSSPNFTQIPKKRMSWKQRV